MTSHHQLFGLHLPGESWLHRLPPVVKLVATTLLIGVLTLPRNPWWGSVLLVLAVTLLLSSRLPARRTLSIAPMFLGLTGLVCLYPLLFGSPTQAWTTAANMIGALLMTRVLTMTTPAMDLVEAMVTLLRPLRFIGVDPDRVGLATMIMLRSVPYLADSFSRVEEAARARGRGRNLAARLTPVVVDAVYYAQRTADAMHARGLGDRAAAEEAGAP